MSRVRVAAASHRFGAFDLARHMHGIEARERVMTGDVFATRHWDALFVGALSRVDASLVLQFLCLGRHGVVLALGGLRALPDSISWTLPVALADR